MDSFVKKILPVKIRRATENDVNDWAEILHKSYENTYSEYVSREYMNNNYNIEKLRENFLQEVSKSDGSSELYILTYGGVSVGILKLGKPIRYYSDGKNYYRDDIEGIGEIKSLHVKAEYQEQGVGSSAIFFAENRLKELNYNKSSIWVKMQNTKAINFYLSQGYQRTNYINPNTNDKAPSMVMEKQLRTKSKEETHKEQEY